MTLQPRGVIPALVTPLDQDGELLEQGLRDVLDHTINGGVDAVFVLGSSGEIYGLTQAQKARVIELTVEHVDGRVPVYCGASEITTRDSIATARLAEQVGGVSALSVLTPYFLSPTQSELVTHFTAVAESTSLPLLMYNNPGRTGVSLSLETILALAEVEGIVGIKESSGSMGLALDVLYQRPEGFSFIMGRDNLIFSALVNGADGAIASTANIAPALVKAIYSAVRTGDLERAHRLQGALTPLRNLVDKATFPVVLKEGLRIAGVEAGYCLAPARELEEPWRTRLTQVVTAIQAMDL